MVKKKNKEANIDFKKALEIRECVDFYIREFANIDINLYKDDQPSYELKKIKHYLVKIRYYSSNTHLNICMLEENYKLFKNASIQYMHNLYN